MHIVSAELDQCLYGNSKVRHAQAYGNAYAYAQTCQEDGCTGNYRAAFAGYADCGFQDDGSCKDDKCIQDECTCYRCTYERTSHGEAQADGNCRAYETAYGDSRAFR